MTVPGEHGRAAPDEWSGPGRPPPHRAVHEPLIHPPFASAVAAPTVPAEAGLRLVARLLDTFLTFLCTLLVGLTVTGIFLPMYGGDMDRAGPEYGIPMIIAIVAVPFLYEWVQVAKWGKTVGKHVVGIRVCASGGEAVPLGRAAVRALCYSPGIYYVPNYLPVLAQLNVLWMLWDKPWRQCLHDKAAKTIVVKDNRAPRS